LLQFLGLAEHIYTEKYGQLVGMKLAVERLKARREQYGSTLNELAGDLLNVEGLEQSVNAEVVRQAEERIDTKLKELRATLNKPSKISAQTWMTQFFGLLCLSRGPFGQFAGR
jgi:hypothetical protein